MAYNYPSPKRDESVIEVLHGKEVSISFDIHCFVRYIISINFINFVNIDHCLYCFDQVPDPYRWMEDPDSEETKEFVKNQNSISQPYINSCEDKHRITEKLTSLWNYPKSTVPHKEGQRFYYGYNSGLQNQQ